MRKSSPILPIAFYDDLFDQQRFNSHSANADQLELVYPFNALPHFQLRRTKALTACTKFYLRNVITDLSANYGFYKQVPEPASIFSTYAAENFFGGLPQRAGTFNDG